MSQTVVLLHAFPLDHRMWADQVAGLAAAGHQVLALDLPGFGGTALPDVDPSLDVVAEAIAQRLADEGIDHAVLVGLSLGGYVVMAMIRGALMRARAESLDALILCDTKASADAPEAVSNRLRLADAVQADPGNCGRILRQAVLPGLFGQTTHANRPEVVDMVGGWLDQADPSSVAWYQRAMAARPDSHDLLRSLSAPALVLWGSEDALSPSAEQATMLAALGSARESVIEGVGHLSAVEDPAAVTAQLQEFLGSLPRI